jgi:hypothetical protein
MSYWKLYCLWDNEPVRPQKTVRHMRIARWIPKATNTRSECVIRSAYPQQQWLHERASNLSYSYIHCLSCFVCIYTTSESAVLCTQQPLREYGMSCVFTFVYATSHTKPLAIFCIHLRLQSTMQQDVFIARYQCVVLEFIISYMKSFLWTSFSSR